MTAYDPHIAHASSTDGYWAAQGTVAGTTIQSQSDPTHVGCGICTVHWSRVVPAGLREDLCATSFAIAKIAGADRNILAITDMPSIETILTTLLTNMATKQSNAYTAIDFTWHLRAASAPRDGPAVRRTTISIPGGGASSRMPDQDTSTTTLATPSRKHWGRLYWPGINLSQNDGTYGRLTNSYCDLAAQWADAALTALYTAGFAWGVWSHIGQGFLDTYGVHVDNVWDIQRRRRAKQRSYIKVYGN